MSRKILVILGHPSAESFCAALADTYVAAAREAGHQVKLFRLGDLDFDPVLRHGYAQRQELEAGLIEIQQAITWAEHLVFVYPIWWGGIPAILKGFFDRVFLPGYAFRYRPNSALWDKLLIGRSAHAIATMDTPAWYFRLIYRSPGHNQIKKTILGFCGIKPVRISTFGPVRGSSSKQRAQWLKAVEGFARKQK